ncbi:RTC4-like domain-containing protein [Peziza echinospora]|nr:RTC4-like domain-containing protein [Peziza echinospora]
MKYLERQHRLSWMNWIWIGMNYMISFRHRSPTQRLGGLTSLIRKKVDIFEVLSKAMVARARNLNRLLNSRNREVYRKLRVCAHPQLRSSAEIARPKFLDPRTLDGPATGENKKASKKIKIGSSPKKTGTAFYNPLEDRNDLFNSPDHLQVAQLCSQLEKEGSQTSLLNSPSKKRKTEYLSDSDGSALSEVPSCASSLRYDDDEDISLPNIDFDTSFFDNPTQAGPPSCPICHEVYDDDFLALIADDVVQKRSDVQAHLDRCKTHKRHSAEKICRARKYPALDIDWRKLKLRIVKHIPHLCEILEQKRKSEYRDGLWEEANRKTKNKGARKLFESDFQSHTPGYYGPKGAHVMLDTIMQKLANRIRELGTNDRLIAGGGVSGFVQAVLVPELGVRLIMEDMAVNEDKAKIIAKDTVKIGELVNDDEGSMDFDDFDDDDDDDGFGDVVEEEKAGRKRRSRREESGSGKGATTTAGTTGKTGKTGKGKKWVTL